MTMRVLVYRLNAAPEPIGVGKYTGEMAAWLAGAGCEVRLVTAYPYYPGWNVAAGYPAWRYSRRVEDGVTMVRCPLYVPARPSGSKRMAHLFSFAMTSLPAVIWQSLTWRPDAIVAVAPTLFAAPGGPGRMGRRRPHLAAYSGFRGRCRFRLGLLDGGWLRRLALGLEAWLLRRFSRVSSISDNMCHRLAAKGVPEARIQYLPNWVDTDEICPLDDLDAIRAEFGVPADRLVALYAGNMNAKQGIETIIEAAQAMPADARCSSLSPATVHPAPGWRRSPRVSAISSFCRCSRPTSSTGF
jgi:colanic acid biosynthesis glycosyl transferase WcaI